MNEDLPAASLSRLADEIGREVRAAEDAWRDAVGHAIKAGQLLIEAKSLVRHGDWLPWLEHHFPGSARTASNYMRLARNSADVADLPTVRDAIAALASPRPAERTPAPDLPSEPCREEYGTDEFSEIHYLMAKVEYERDRQIAFYRMALAKSAQALAAPGVDQPGVERATRYMAAAHTGIAYLEAERAAEDADEADFDEKCKAVQDAWLAHQAMCQRAEIFDNAGPDTGKE